jgi:hypothetical protein
VPLVDLLCAHREVQAQERLTAGSLWEEQGFVFAQPNGRPIDPKADHPMWKALLEAAGVREPGFMTPGTPLRRCSWC